MKLKNNKLLKIVTCLSIMFMGSGSVIYAMPQTSVTNNFSTGVVDIELDEYMIEDGKEVAWKDNPTVLPGTKVSKIPRITNDGNDCYVRVSLTFRDNAEITEDDIFGMSDSWVKAEDGYYYYKDILKTGDAVDVFQGLQIPDDFSQEYEGTNFYLDIDAHAIQSQNFEPDFSSSTPWGTIEILECEKEGQYDITTFKKSDSKEFKVEYQGDVKKLFTNEENFFMNFPVLMPGDEYEDYAELSNNSNKDIKLYFRSEALDSEILEKIQLKIVSEINGKKKTIYEGPLKADELKDNYLLGVIKKNSDAKLLFSISVPAELNNQYSLLTDQVKWIFSTEEIKNSVPKTGDETNIGIYLILIGASLGLVAIVLERKSKDEQPVDKI